MLQKRNCVGSDEIEWPLSPFPFRLEGKRISGRVVLSPWLEEGVGRATRARIAMRARNILHFVLL